MLRLKKTMIVAAIIFSEEAVLQNQKKIPETIYISREALPQCLICNTQKLATQTPPLLHLPLKNNTKNIENTQKVSRLVI